jgi:hypothetical protein
MYIPEFKDLVSNIESFGENPKTLDLFPPSFINGLCVKNKDIYFPANFKSLEDVSFHDGIIVSSTGDNIYSESNRDFLGFMILDVYNSNYIVPVVAQYSTRELVLDSSVGFKTSVRKFDEISSLLGLITDIDKIQSQNSKNFLLKGREILENSIGLLTFEDKTVDNLYSNIDQVLYSTKTD